MSAFPVVLLYIDPGIFILIVQILAASMLGVVVYFRKTTRQVLSLLRILPRRKGGREPE